MKAIILAGGFGTRLRSVVGDVPKPMALIAGKPFLEYQIRFLKEFGIKEIIIAVHHMADNIKSYFGNGMRWDVDITYSEEDLPLGTAGAIKKAEKYIDNTFLVLNGDTYSHMDLNKFIEFHKSKRGIFSMAVTKSLDSSHYGNISLQEDKITSYAEKIDGEGLINSGVYLFEPKIFDYIEPEKNVSIEKEIFPKLVNEGNLWGYRYDDYFVDIGRPETYEKFKADVLGSLMLKEHEKVREAMKKISKNGIDIVLVTDEQKRLKGVVNDRIMKEFMINGGNLEEPLINAMITNPIVAREEEGREKINELLMAGINHLPIVNKDNEIKNVEFRAERVKKESFPILRGRAPLRIGFAGGGTDLPHFFEKYGGVVINATIDKYCYATIVKRGDSKIIINSDLGDELIVDSRKEIAYDNRFDLIKAIVNIMKPNFGFELYLHNDLPPGRGLGSSATISILIISLLSNLMDIKYDDYKIAELAFKTETDELKIKGGWQDQYAAVTGGFSFMEFSKDKTIIYPLRLKEEVISELNEHMLLCYIGQTHFSGEQHTDQENTFVKNEEEIAKIQNEHKEIAISIKDSLLTNNLESLGRHLHESWENKKKLGNKMSNPKINQLYEIGLRNGAHGGRLLGSGGGGYILFHYAPTKRNMLTKALREAGGIPTDFNFEFNGTKIWSVKSKF